MVVLFLIQLLREERHDIHVRLLLDFDDNVVNFLCFGGSKSNADRLDWNEQLSDSVIDGGEGKFLSLEGLPNQVVCVDDLLVLNVLQFFRLDIQPESI